MLFRSKSYQMILGQIIAALKRLHVDAVFCPISDIALAGSNKKISGNAQKRSRKFILHHGTILYDFDLEKIERYLKIPKDIPEYRRERSHLDFVTNIAVTAADIKEALKHVFVIEREENDLSDEEEACLRSFLDEKDNRIKLSG